MTKEVKQWALTRHSKGHNKPMFTCIPNSLHIASTMAMQDMTTVSKTRPMIGVELPKLRVLRQNLLAGSALP
jgi:hypothetical protein